MRKRETREIQIYRYLFRHINIYTDLYISIYIKKREIDFIMRRKYRMEKSDEPAK